MKKGRPSDAERQRLADKLAKRLTDEGRLIEAGWQMLRHFTLPANAPVIQLTEMRKAFFLGAEHLYTSIMGVMDDGTEPTAKDMERMEKIHTELETFRVEIAAK